MTKKLRAIENRTVQFKIKMTRNEHAQLFKLAKAKGLSASDFVRQWIRNQTDQAV
jgi:hypothetical protein